jgi:hypothetical protein
VRVDRVGLATLTGGEHPHPRRQFCWYIDNGLPVSDQALREMAADALGAFDRPDPLRMRMADRQHPLVAVLVSAEPSGTQDVFPMVDDLNGGRPFVGVHADDHWSHADSPRRGKGWYQARWAALLRAGQTPLEPHSATVLDGGTP